VLLLRSSLRQAETAVRIESAVAAALYGGPRSPDLGGSMTTNAMGDAVLAAI
jgi:3-isopropylmalate dehydrogenase